MDTSAYAQRLDPVGRLRLPRRTTLLRLVLVATLLLTAAGVLYGGAGGGPDPPPPAPAAGVMTPAPAAATPRPAIPDGMVGVPVSLADPAALAVLRPGDNVDLLAVPPDGTELAPLATAAAVLAVDRAAAGVLLCLTDDQAATVLATAAGTRYAVVIRP